MQLNKSPKIFQKYKCDYPKNTINRIQKGFKKMDLEISYNEKTYFSRDEPVYIGVALVDILGWAQNGKGTSSILSKTSAFAELAERFSTGFIGIKIPLPKNSGKFQNLLKNINQRTFLKGYEKVSNQEVIDHNLLNKNLKIDLSKEEYEYWKKQGLFNTHVAAYSLVNKTYEKIPISFIELYSTSNGLASGNTKEEAIAQASFEIFERYAADEIIRNHKICNKIDIDSIGDKKIQKYVELLNDLKIDVIIKDFTLNNNVPVVGVLFVDQKIKNDKNKLKKARYYRRISVASHLNLNEAIIRSITENFQSLGIEENELNKIDQYDKLYDAWTNTLGKEYKGLNEKFKYFSRKSDYFGDLSFLEKGKNIDFEELKFKINQDCFDDVNDVIKICKNNRWDLLLVDYTHKILGFPTFRVIIPPISINFDPFSRKILKINDFKKRVNSFYGIKNFYQYLKDNNWIKDKKEIKKLIENIESYLSEDLSNYHFYLNRENNFFQLINLFHILPFLYMALEKYDEAVKYFKALLQIDFKPPIESSFYNNLYETKYSPDIYDSYINSIENNTKINQRFNYEIKNNLFDSEISTMKLEKKHINVLKRINESFV